MLVSLHIDLFSFLDFIHLNSVFLTAFYYPHVKFVYTDEVIIPDHKTVKQSSYRLQTLLAAEG